MIIAFSSSIGPVPLQVLLSEKHNSEVEVTSNPIETGAEVNDHAYVKPKKVELEVADGNAAATFNALVTFQEAREPFTLVTGFRVYENMVITEVDATRDKTHSKVLKATVRCREVIIVETGTAEDDSKDGKDKSKSDKTSKDKANNSKTADKTNNGANAGDKGGTTVPAPKSQSLLKSWSGGGGGSGNIAGGLGPGGVGGSGNY